MNCSYYIGYVPNLLKVVPAAAFSYGVYGKMSNILKQY